MIWAYLIVLAVLAGSVYLISAPLLAVRRETTAAERLATEVADLEAARDAKYREIRDAEMDMLTGKLSDEDYAAIDRTLRAEAVDILHRLDAAQAAGTPAPNGAARSPQTPAQSS